MPNIDTRGTGRPARPPGARPMLGRLRAAAAAAPLLLSNGNFYTAATDQPRAEAAVVVDGRITFVGKTPDALRRAPPGARRIDLHGATVLPGLTDAHAHLSGIGERELTFNLEGTTSLAELKNKLRERAAGGKAGSWLFGRGWLESRWNPPAFPTRQDLDAAAADRRWCCSGPTATRWSPTAWRCSGPESIEIRPTRRAALFSKTPPASPRGS